MQLSREFDTQLEVQRSLEQSDLNLEVQRQEFLTEARERENNSSLSERISQELNAGVPLEENIRKQLEAHFNTDLSKVRVHTDGKAHELAKSVNAIAFTTGKDIFFQTGKYDPNSSAGFELLAHETAHTIQQALGLVRPGIDSSPNLESDAKLEGQKAAGNKRSLERQATNFNDYLLKPNLELGIAPKTTNLEGKSVAVQREPVKTATPTPTPTPAKTLSSINRTGGAHAKAGVNLRDQPSSEGKLIKNLPQTTLFFVSNELEGGWYQIKVTSSPDASVVGQTGFIPSHLVKLAPDKGAKMHVVNAGDNAIRLARKHFNAEPGFDIRFFVNVLHHINPEAIPNPSGTKWEENTVLKNYAIWIPSHAFAKTLQGVVKSGTRPDAAYDAVKDGAEAIVKATIGQLPGGQKVLDTIQSIGVNASKVLNDPGAFVSNLGKAVGQGFTGFTADLPQHLEKSVVSLFTGTMSTVDLPKIWDASGVLHVGLQIALSGIPGRTPEEKFIQAVPGGMGAINAASEAKTAFLSIQDKGFAATARQYYEGAALESTILGGLKTYVMTTVVKQGLITLGSMFIPGAGIIQAAIKLYETIKFIWDKFNDLANTVKAITSSLADIANGKIEDAARKITSSFVGFLGLGVGFLARVAKLDGIASKIQKLFEKIRAPILKAFNAIVNKFKQLVGKSLGKPVVGDKSSTKPVMDSQNPSNKTGLLKDVMTGVIARANDFTLDGENYRTWVEVKQGNADFILNPTPTEARVKLKTYQDKLNNRDARAGDSVASIVQPYIANAQSIVTDGEANLQKRLLTPNSSAARQGLTDVAKDYAKRLQNTYKTIETSLRTGSEYDYPFVTDITGVKRMKSVSIKFNCPTKLIARGLKPEFDKQVQGQQAGLNKLLIKEWFTNRSSYLSGGRSNTEQVAFRDREENVWKTDKQDDIRSKPWASSVQVEIRQIQAKLSSVLTAQEIKDLLDPNIAVSIPVAEKVANLIWSQQAALHDPDQVAGGRADGLSGFGDTDVNSTIGGQWVLVEKGGTSVRINKLDVAVAKVPEKWRSQLRMNAVLRS